MKKSYQLSVISSRAVAASLGRRVCLLLLITVYWSLVTAAHAAFTEFYCNASTGSNVNAGSTTGAAAYTATNGGWNSGTGVFTPTSGNPSLTVAVGDFASVYTDGATVTGFVGRVTAVNTTTITVSITAKSGTIPTTAGTGISCKVGGVWLGPNGASGFPFGFIAGTLTNAAPDLPRVNLKNNATYSITAGLNQSVAGPICFQGYSATPGDLGRATIDGGTSGASYVLLSLTGGHASIVDIILQNNGATGTAAATSVSSQIGAMFLRCIIHDVRGTGFSGGVNSVFFVECEAYLCGRAVTGAGFALAGGCTAIRCIAHDNTGSGVAGFSTSGQAGPTLVNCIADTNGVGIAASPSGNSAVHIIGCDFYNNTAEGVSCGASANTFVTIVNCNFVKNGTYGISNTGQRLAGKIDNCGFGSGTQANASGATNNMGDVVITGSVTYAANVTPWVDPANGDFRINLAAAKGTGRGAFTQTAASYAGTIAYPDIGAAQHLESPSGFPLSRTLP